MNSPILEVKNLKKNFGPLEAVKGIHFSIPKGVCFGLLGPNGAGKTTTIEMIEGITEPTSGEIFFQGELRGDTFKQNCGIQFQSTALPDFIRVNEILNLFSSFYEKKANREELISFCDLSTLLNRPVHELSGGQRQRVLLATALIHDPELIFLDEPTTGLDPHARRGFWDLIRTLKARKKTIILTTHYMEEAYSLCDEIAIMNQGCIQAQGTPDGLLKEVFEGVLMQIPTSDIANLDLSTLSTKPTKIDELYEFATSQPNELLQELLAKKVSLKNLRIRSHTLDDLFLHLTQDKTATKG